MIIPHPSSAVDTNRRPASVDNVSEPAVTDEQHHRPAPSQLSSADGNINVTVSYSLWIGSNITEKRSINITTDHNVTFYEIMQRAAEVDNAFTYVPPHPYRTLSRDWAQKYFGAPEMITRQLNLTFFFYQTSRFTYIPSMRSSFVFDIVVNI